MHIKMINNLSSRYYQKTKERSSKRLVKDIKFSQKKLQKKRQNGREKYENLSEHEKQKLVEYRKSYYIKRKNASQ